MEIYEVILISIFVLATGACIGSFLNVAALRAISKESIIFPASKCPLCGTHIKWFDNIPVISYFLTIKGKCRCCGRKVSIQYPIVEILTSLVFFAVFYAYGFTIKTLLILILLCLSIVITITDIKKNEIYDVHNWCLIVMSMITGLYIKGINGYADVAIGLITGAVLMEVIAKLAYYLVRKETPVSMQENDNNEKESVENQNQISETNTENNNAEDNDAEDIDINDYVEKNKRAFGEGDTYLAAAAGALLGWQCVIAAVALAIILQTLCIFPQFLISLYKQKEYKLLISLSLFVFLALLYWLLSSIFTLHLYVVFAILIALIFFAIYSISALKKIVTNQGFKAIPFGPALLFASFLIFFFGKSIIDFLINTTL